MGIYKLFEERIKNKLNRKELIQRLINLEEID